MISFNISISNPWAKNNFANLWNNSWLPFKNKGVELEIIRHSYDIFQVHANITARTDHAGVSAKLALFGYSIHFSFYDTRHWNYDTNAWEVYDEAYYAKANREAQEWQEIIEAKKAARRVKKEAKDETTSKKVKRKNADKE